jgi:hypothetical protein
MTCDCEFTPDPDDPDDDFHFRRVCEFCGGVWWSLHCPHDGRQNPCPRCKRTPTPAAPPHP